MSNLANRLLESFCFFFEFLWHIAGLFFALDPELRSIAPTTNTENWVQGNFRVSQNKDKIMIRINDETSVNNSTGCKGRCVKRVQGKTEFQPAKKLGSGETSSNRTAGTVTAVIATVGGAMVSVTIMAFIFVVTARLMFSLAFGIFAAGAISILDLLLPFGGMM